MQAVPNTEAEIQAKLDQLKAELAPLEQVKTHVDSRIHRYCQPYPQKWRPDGIGRLKI